MSIHKATLGMIRAIGWDAMCDSLTMTRQQLENRLYERRGQGITVDLALEMQAASGTALFAQAVAVASGGSFVKLPAGMDGDQEELLAKFNRLYTHVGLLSARYAEYTADNEVDKRERADLIAIGDEISRATQELLALTFRTFCAPEQGVTE